MRSPRVLLVLSPPFWPNMPPTGLGFLQASLLRRGITCGLFDLNNILYRNADRELQAQWPQSRDLGFERRVTTMVREVGNPLLNQAIERLCESPVVGFSCYQGNFEATLTLVRRIKEKSRDVRIVLGGPEIARRHFQDPNFTKEPWAGSIDLFVTGEGEKPLLEFVTGPGGHKQTLFDQLPDLNGLPFPVYGGIDFSDYPKRGAYPIQLSRGCIRACRFCSERLLYKGFRSRDAESVMAEIRHHRTANGIQSLVFFDSLLNADLDLLEELCGRLISEWGGIPWEAQIAIRSDMPARLLRKMKESGCYNLFIGLESGSPSVLRRMNKGFTPEEAIDFFKKLNGARLAFGISLITGYPGETEEEFREGLTFVIDNKHLIPKIEQINPFTYYEGTSADRDYDYRSNQAALPRLAAWKEALSKNRIRHTKAFIGNLMDKNG